MIHIGTRRRVRVAVLVVAVLVLAVVLVAVVRNQLSGRSAPVVTPEKTATVTATDTRFAPLPTGAVLGGPIAAFAALYGPLLAGSMEGGGTATFGARLEGEDIRIDVGVGVYTTGTRAFQVVLFP